MKNSFCDKSLIFIAPTPTAIAPAWKDTQLISSSSQIVFPNETLVYQENDIYGSGIALDTGTRWIIDVQVDNLAQDVGEASTGIILKGHNTKIGYLQLFALVYQFGGWSIGYQSKNYDPDFTYWHTFENLRTPNQHFELFISGDGKSIALKNNEGFEYHHTMQEEMFSGAKSIMTTTQIGPQTKITLSTLVVSQLRKDEIGNSSTYLIIF